MNPTIFAAAAVLLVHSASVPAQDDKQQYSLRAAQTDASLFRELDRGGKGFLTREETRGDLRLGLRFDDIDINRDGIVTSEEMRRYIEQTYGAPSAAPRERR